jgi:long-chain acyl-CoA synthetase
MTQPTLPVVAETLTKLLEQRALSTPAAPAQWSLNAGGQWQRADWRAYFALTARTAAGLRRLGLRAGQRLGIMAPSCAEWDVVQLAALAAGAVVVGVDVHEHDERLAQIFDLCELDALVVAEEGMLGRLPSAARARLELLVTFEPRASQPGVIAWPALLEAAGSAPEWVDEAAPDSHALIVFTSGTTGGPKGIAYTHRQVHLACMAIIEAFPNIGAGARLACWLPLSNLFQRMINFCAIARGAQTYYVSNPRDIMQYLPRIAPHVFIAVPRFYEKFFAGLRERVETRPRWQRRLFDLALWLARRKAGARRDGRRPGLILALASAVLDAVALRPARAALGGRVRILVSGSAPMPKWLLEDMAAMGMPVYEAYGMSENIVPICVNRPGAVKFGTVGKALDYNEIRIAEDGELLVRGPGVFVGYLGEPAAPRDADGFLATGDYATQDAEGFVTLTGRKSEIFKTSTGRRVAPAGVEALIKQLPQVEQCLVLGANRPFIVAIIWVAAEPLTQIKPRIAADVARMVGGLPDYQRPAGVLLASRMPSLERGEITSNLKLRRRQIADNYAAEIENLYGQIQQGGDTIVVAQT